MLEVQAEFRTEPIGGDCSASRDDVLYLGALSLGIEHKPT
jgi:hypothetical protein